MASNEVKSNLFALKSAKWFDLLGSIAIRWFQQRSGNWISLYFSSFLIFWCNKWNCISSIVVKTDFSKNQKTAGNPIYWRASPLQDLFNNNKLSTLFFDLSVSSRSVTTFFHYALKTESKEEKKTGFWTEFGCHV